jgi:hypothetical protein
MRNNKPGLMLYSVNGPSALPVPGGAFLCVSLPLRRTFVVNAGGTPPPASDCSGILSIDMNTFATGALGGNPKPELSTAGTQVWTQYWARDQGFPPPGNTVLTNGLRYVVCP